MCLAYMDLQGEANVCSTNCSKVVQIVSKHIFGKRFELCDLPSSSTALNFADEAHFIGKQQIVEEVVDKTNEHITYV